MSKIQELNELRRKGIEPRRVWSWVLSSKENEEAWKHYIKGQYNIPICQLEIYLEDKKNPTISNCFVDFRGASGRREGRMEKRRLYKSIKILKPDEAILRWVFGEQAIIKNVGNHFEVKILVDMSLHTEIWEYCFTRNLKPLKKTVRGVVNNRPFINTSYQRISARLNAKLTLEKLKEIYK